jgi:hypothetical protein
VCRLSLTLAIPHPEAGDDDAGLRDIAAIANAAGFAPANLGSGREQTCSDTLFLSRHRA